MKISKREWFGLAVLGFGGVLGLVAGGTLGLALAAVCLVLGLVLFVASEGLAISSKAKPTTKESTANKTNLLVLVKEVHARPYRLGKFQEIRGPDQADLQFEVFAHCWIVNDADQPIVLPLHQVSLTKPDGASVVLPRVRGDLDSWRLGRLRDELDSWGVRYVRANHEPMLELNLDDPLPAGATRQGWLHLRAENLTPAQLSTGTVTLSIIDSDCESHIGSAKGPHQVPGRVWPSPLRLDTENGANQSTRSSRSTT
jgi:hypothetical protein